MSQYKHTPTKTNFIFLNNDKQHIPALEILGGDFCISPFPRFFLSKKMKKSIEKPLTFQNPFVPLKLRLEDTTVRK